MSPLPLLPSPSPHRNFFGYSTALLHLKANYKIRLWFSPKLRDKIRNREPGNEAKYQRPSHSMAALTVLSLCDMHIKKQVISVLLFNNI